MERQAIAKIRGKKETPKNHAPAATSPFLSQTYYEGKITSLFAPWLTSKIPDGTWQTLQKNLGRIVKDIIAGRK